jgi:hypothetical protein
MISGIESVSLPGFSGTAGRLVEDNRRFVEGVLWVGRNGGAMGLSAQGVREVGKRS